MEGPELLGRGGRPACDYPTCLYCVGRERRGVSSTRRYSTISEGWEYDSTSAAGGWESPKGTTVESEPMGHGGGGSPIRAMRMALNSKPLHRRAVKFRWAMRIALTRTRRVNGASSRPVSQAYMLLRVDGPSIT